MKKYSGGMRRRHRHRGEHRRHPRTALPRRADDRARPAQPQPGLGDRPGDGRRGHHRAADHAVPRRGRPAGRPHRGDRPRQGHRRGHPAASSRRRSAPARCTCGCVDAEQRAEAERVLRRRLGVAGRSSTPTRPRCPARRPPTPSGSPAALGRAGPRPASPSTEFALGQPSLDEVFLALTGHPPRTTTPRRHAA